MKSTKCFSPLLTAEVNTVNIPIQGPNGKTAIVTTGWILESGSKTPKLTTALVK